MGDSPKWVKSKKRRKKKEEERLNNGENNGQATHGARKHAWRTQAAWANMPLQANYGNNIHVIYKIMRTCFLYWNSPSFLITNLIHVNTCSLYAYL